jgi:hypothetical protein
VSRTSNGEELSPSALLADERSTKRDYPPDSLRVDGAEYDRSKPERSHENRPSATQRHKPPAPSPNELVIVKDPAADASPAPVKKRPARRHSYHTKNALHQSSHKRRERNANGSESERPEFNGMALGLQSASKLASSTKNKRGDSMTEEMQLGARAEYETSKKIGKMHSYFLRLFGSPKPVRVKIYNAQDNKGIQ